jgi:protocatechuate 3,4-dioxygenase beta subunit
MGKILISIVAVASLAFALWFLFQWEGDSDSSATLSNAGAAALETNASASQQSEGELLQSSGNSSANRSAVKPLTGESSDAEPTIAGAVPIHEEGETVIEVLVVDGANRPIEGAIVTSNKVEENPQALDLSQIFRSAGRKTNSQGLVSMVLKVDELVRVIAKADGFASGASKGIELDADAVQKRVTITLTEGGSVGGRLLDVHEVPAADIPITIHLEQWPGSVGSTPSLQMEKTDTAGDGTLLFENLTPGKYTLYTRAKNEARTLVPNQSVALEVHEGKRTMVQFAQISDSFVQVHGVVIRNSEPLGKAGISIHWADRSRGYLGKKVKTGDDGRFTIILDEGAKYSFHISPRGGGNIFREIEIPSVARHEVEISFDTCSLAGLLLGPEGKPVEGLEIIAYGSSSVVGAGTTIQFTMSKAGGAFEFIGLVDGSYKLEASTLSVLPEPAAAPKHPYLGSAELKDLTLNAGESREGVELRMSAAAAVDGRVSDAAGKAVARATIECRGEGSLGSSQWNADKSGMFLAGGLQPGNYLVRATRQKQLSPWISIQAKLNTTTTVEGLVLQPGCLIDIEALRGSEPMGRAYVSIESEEGVEVDARILRNGKGQLGPVLPGTYTLTVKLVGDDKSEASQTIFVQGKATLKVEIEMPE